MHSGQDLPSGVFSKDDCYAERRWRQIQYMADFILETLGEGVPTDITNPSQMDQAKTKCLSGVTLFL